MATQKSGAAIRKRQQIQNSSKVMFIWVAGASVIVGAALVVGFFLANRLVFNEKVLSAKNTTVRTLQDNNKNVDDLRNNIRVLNTNAALNSARVPGENDALQVVLDALPATANDLAIGASLQNRLLANIDGLTIESFSVDALPSSVENTTDTSGTVVTETGTAALDSLPSIGFSLTISGAPSVLQQALKNIEKSIRVVDFDSISVQSSANDRQTMTMHGFMYYKESTPVKLQTKEIKP